MQTQRPTIGAECQFTAGEHTMRQALTHHRTSLATIASWAMFSRGLEPEFHSEENLGITWRIVRQRQQTRGTVERLP